MSEALKKFWFVILSAFLLLAMFGYVTYEENKDKVRGKTYNGQQVVFSIGDLVVTADMLFDKINEIDSEASNEMLFERFQLAVFNQAIPITEEMREQARNVIYDTIIPYFQYSYGENYSYYLQQWMESEGFTDEEDIMAFTLPWYVIQPLLLKNYYIEHIDEYFPAYQKGQNPRLISHILVAMDDPEDPNTEEKAKVQAIENALKTRDFGAVAKEFSDDTGSAEKDGSIGLVDNTNQSNYVSEFAAVAMDLGEGEVSEWVKTTYGWHLIKNMGSSKAALMEDEELYTRLSAVNLALNNKILYETAESLGLDFFGNDALQKYIMDQSEVDE